MLRVDHVLDLQAVGVIDQFASESLQILSVIGNIRVSLTAADGVPGLCSAHGVEVACQATNFVRMQ